MTTTTPTATTPSTYTDPATARRYVDAVTSLSVLGRRASAARWCSPTTPTSGPP
jgi:hypothetical protein